MSCRVHHKVNQNPSLLAERALCSLVSNGEDRTLDSMRLNTFRGYALCTFIYSMKPCPCTCCGCHTNTKISFCSTCSSVQASLVIYMSMTLFILSLWEQQEHRWQNPKWHHEKGRRLNSRVAEGSAHLIPFLGFLINPSSWDLIPVCFPYRLSIRSLTWSSHAFQLFVISGWGTQHRVLHDHYVI